MGPGDAQTMKALSDSRLAALRGEAPKEAPETDAADAAHRKAWLEMADQAKTQLADADKAKLAAYFGALAQKPDLEEDRPVLRYMEGWAKVRAGDMAGAAEMREAEACIAATWSGHHDIVLLLSLYGDIEGSIAEQQRIVDYGHEEYFWFASNGTLAAKLRNVRPADAVQPSQVDVWALLRETDPEFDASMPVSYALDAAANEKARIEKLLAGGKVDEALARARALRDRWMVRDEDWVGLARSVAEAGRKDAAAELVNMGLKDLYAQLEAGADTAGAHNDIAWTLARARMDLPKALEHAQKAVELDATKPALWDTLAEVYWAQGDRDKAVATERKAADLDKKSDLFQRRVEHFQKDKIGSVDVVED